MKLFGNSRNELISIFTRTDHVQRDITWSDVVTEKDRQLLQGSLSQSRYTTPRDCIIVIDARVRRQSRRSLETSAWTRIGDRTHVTVTGRFHDVCDVTGHSRGLRPHISFICSFLVFSCFVFTWFSFANAAGFATFYNNSFALRLFLLHESRSLIMT